jgi:hypothetical protein
MKTKITILFLLMSIAIFSQGDPTTVDNLKIKSNLKNNRATRMLVQDTLNGRVTWILKSSMATQAVVDLKAPLASPTFTGTVSGISKAMVGLPLAENTTDLSKPISTDTQAALNLKSPINSPTFTGTVSGISKAMVGLPLAENTTDLSKPISTDTQIALNLKAPIASPTFTGTVSGISKAMVGLPLAENTTDLSKPISTATQTALNLKENLLNKTSSLTASVVLYPNNNSVISGLSDLDATVVHNTRPELIAGEKTFSDKLVVTPEITSFSFIKSHGDLISLSNINANGNINSNANITSTGDIVSQATIKSVGDLISLSNINANGNINSNANITSTGDIVSQATIKSVGDLISLSNINANGNINSNANITSTGDIVSQATIKSVGDLFSLSNINATKDIVSLANIKATGNINSLANIKAIGTITGSNIIKESGLISQNLLADGSVFDKYNFSNSSSTFFQNISLLPTLIDGMIVKLPLAGNYKIDYNGQFDIVANITQQAVLDLNVLYLNLNAQIVTNPVFPLFGAGSTILPGVYETSGAVSAVGTITLDGKNNPNSIFIFRTIAAAGFGAGCTFNLVNGATANNVFFIAGGAVTLGAGSNLSGNFISPFAAIGVGAGASLTGRVFSQAAAITNNGNVITPILASPFPMGILPSFAIFTGNGSVANVGSNIIDGDVGTNLGTITGFDTATLTGSIYLPGQTGSICKFSIYVDGVIVPTSTRERINAVAKTDVILSDTVTTTPGQIIAIKVTNSTGISRFYNRNLTITKY